MANAHIKAFGISDDEARRNVSSRYFIIHQGVTEELSIQQTIGISHSNTMQAFQRSVYGDPYPFTILTTHRGGYELSGYIMPSVNSTFYTAIKSKDNISLLYYQEDAGIFELAEYVISSAMYPTVDEAVFKLDATLTMDGYQTRGWMRTATGTSTSDKPSFDQDVRAGVFPVVLVDRPASPSLTSVTINLLKDSTDEDYVLDGWTAGTGWQMQKGTAVDGQAALTGAQISIDARTGAVPNDKFLFGMAYEHIYRQG